MKKLIILLFINFTACAGVLSQDLKLNEFYVICLGNTPKESEISGKLALEKAQWILDQRGFKENFYNWMKEYYLENVSNGILVQGLMDSEQIVSFQKDSKYYDKFLYDYKRWKELLLTKHELHENEVSYHNTLLRFIDNPYFDRINMGDDNLINKSFYLLLGRYPTVAEKESAIEMLNNNNSVLLLQPGNCKKDYLSILGSNLNFVERQIQFWFEKLRLRKPTLIEIIEIVKELNDYKCFTTDCIIQIVLTQGIEAYE